ncbi:MAG: uroporphyrinogen decarboxylase [Chloroflexota bacterium]
MRDSRFLRACRREPTDVTPIWLMRQAGRYMPEYRAIREKVSMLDAIRTPDIAAEITLQPISAFKLDAAIVFADILTPLIGMGLDLDFVKGEGPSIDNPIRTVDDVKKLRTPPATEALPYAMLAIRQIVAELTPRHIPLIGFAGAPFTLASYAIEGGGSKNYERAKGLMYDQPAAWQSLMEKLVTVISDYLIQQVEAGASALQIFDSWVGALGPRDYAQSVAPYTRQLIQNVKHTGVPIIYFSTGTGPMLDQVAALGSDVISVDWRIQIDHAWDQIGHDRAIQGNLDPVLLLAAWPAIQANVDAILQQANGQPGHIFNLGHGILPGTPVETVRRLVDYVHEKTAKTEPVKQG